MEEPPPPSSSPGLRTKEMVVSVVERRIVILGFLNGMKPFVSGEFQFGRDGARFDLVQIR